jgi:D-glucosaminate-specific PTS system IIB component
MVDIYKMAAPPGVEVKILNVADAAKQFESNEFDNKNIFILFKNIDMAYKAYKAGVKYTDLQLGGIPNEAGKKMIFTAISLGQEEIRQLNEMNEDGVNIELHIVPEEPAMSFEAAVKKYNL